VKCQVAPPPTGVTPAEGGRATWLLTRRAEQSQFGADVSSLKCEVSSGPGAVAEDEPSCRTKPIWGRLPWDCGLRSERRMCQTKPNLERMGCLGKRTLHAERLYDVAESAKQSQSPMSEQNHRQASLDDANHAATTESAEQSQSGKEVSGLKCEVSSGTPAPGGDPSRGRLGYMAADPSCETKPIWGRLPWDCGLRSERRMCETKPNPERMGCLGKRALHAERLYDVAESVKQSQSPMSEQNHRQASLDDANHAATTESAEQSQLETSGRGCGFAETQDIASLQARDATCTATGDSAEQSQFVRRASRGRWGPGGAGPCGRCGRSRRS
jgi:hypothetical protein